MASCEAQQILCVQHAFIFSSSAGAWSSEWFPSFLLSTVGHVCLCTLVLMAGLPACVLKEQVLNLPLWQGYGAKISSEALNLAPGGCQRWHLPSLEVLILDTQLAADFPLVLPCCGVWQMAASQRRVLCGDLREVLRPLQPRDCGTATFLLLAWKSGDAYKFPHRHTWVVAVLCSTAYAFRAVSEVSWLMLKTFY